MFFIKKPAPTPMDLKNPIWNYLKAGLADFVIEYVEKHKDEVIAVIVDVLRKLFSAHPEVKKQVFAGLDESEPK